jgi:hypothetical protein
MSQKIKTWFGGLYLGTRPSAQVATVRAIIAAVNFAGLGRIPNTSRSDVADSWAIVARANIVCQLGLSTASRPAFARSLPPSSLGFI